MRAAVVMSGQGRKQRGAALLMAMVIVTLVATFSASMVWQQWRAVQVESAERVRTQATWVLSGALDWAMLILREDQRTGGPDHLGEPWAIPLAEARLSTFLAADSNNNAPDDAGTPDAFLSGQVEDATARYNLRNILSPEGDLIAEEVAVLKRLCEYAGLSPALGDGLAAAWRKATLATIAEDPTMMEKLGGEDARRQAPLQPLRLDDLTWLGVDAATVERLRPMLTVMPVRTKVNLNTASREVLASVVDGLDVGRAARLVQVRQRNPFKSLDSLAEVLGPGSWRADRLAISSDFFEVRGRLRLEDNVIEQRHLVQRAGDEVKVLSQSRFTGLEQGVPGRAP